MGELMLAQQNSLLSFDQGKIDIIKHTVAKGATNDELAMFMHLCQTYQLDPFLKEIWFIKRAKKRKDQQGNWDYKRLSNGEIDYSDAETTIMTSRDGYLKVAQQNPSYDGLQSFAIREGDIFEIDAENFKVIHKFGAKRGRLIGAWAGAYHKGRKPFFCFVDFAEYNEAKSNVWQKYPSAMIQKVAEVFALKRQFGISGLVTKEELSGPDFQPQAAEVTETPTLIPAPKPTQPVAVNWEGFWKACEVLGYTKEQVLFFAEEEDIEHYNKEEADHLYLEMKRASQTKVETTATVEAVEAVKDIPAEEGVNWKSFWLSMKELGFSQNQVHEHAEAESIADYTREQANALLVEMAELKKHIGE